MRMPIIERAFELAGSGKCHNLTELKESLRVEGYEFIGPHLDGRTIRIALRDQLRASVKAAREAEEAA